MSRAAYPLALPTALAVVVAVTTACADGPGPTAPVHPDPGSPPQAARAATGRTTQRPIEEFLAVEPGFLGWFDPVSGLCAGIDYAGFFGRPLSLGTTVAGTVRERTLADGRAEITITLHADNALAVASRCELGSNPLLIGAFPDEVFAGAAPVLGSVHFSITYIAPAPGLPLVSLGEVLGTPETYEVLKEQIEAQATGPLTAAAGYPAGTVGRLLIQQVGRWTPGQLLHKPDQYPGDVFPVETVSLRPVGH